MEILQWKNNVDLVRLAKGLLDNPDEPYPYAYCSYRMPDDQEVRCIIGRLLYGHIPEDNEFWCSGLGIIEAWQKYGLDKMFPNILPDLLGEIQLHHDIRAEGRNILPYEVVSWTELEEMAVKADKAAN